MYSDPLILIRVNIVVQVNEFYLFIQQQVLVNKGLEHTRHALNKLGDIHTEALSRERTTTTRQESE